MCMELPVFVGRLRRFAVPVIHVHLSRNARPHPTTASATFSPWPDARRTGCRQPLSKTSPTPAWMQSHPWQHLARQHPVVGTNLRCSRGRPADRPWWPHRRRMLLRNKSSVMSWRPGWNRVHRRWPTVNGSLIAVWKPAASPTLWKRAFRSGSWRLPKENALFWSRVIDWIIGRFYDWLIDSRPALYLCSGGILCSWLAMLILS